VVKRIAIVAGLVAARVAHADAPVPPEADWPPDTAPPPVVADDPAEPSKLQQELIDRLDKQDAEIAALRSKTRSLEDQLNKYTPLSFLNAYIDVGYFSVAGNGSGIRSDIGHAHFPYYRGKVAGEWVFMGDPLATAINSLGEPADGSLSREDPNDQLRSGGKPTAIVNSVGLAIGRSFDNGIALKSLVELLPRPQHDVLDIELAEVEYRPTDEHDLLISAGKIDSVLGIEYRAQDAPNRIGVTPSLLCRYTCGRTVGVSARLNQGPLGISVALTDGDSFQDNIEQDPALNSTARPFVSGHVQYILPVGRHGLELGVSGAYGRQDAQTSPKAHQWHAGFDARLRDFHGFDITAEYIEGRQHGLTSSTEPCDEAACLSYKAAYVMVFRRMESWLVPYARVDWRSAEHVSGGDFAYESHVGRATLGVHFEMTHRIQAKVEYTFVRELGDTPEFPDDVFTTSVVVSTQ